MKEIYLVTKGCYSDYSVYGVFEDKAIAEEYAAQISDRWDTARVDTRSVYDSTSLRAPAGFRGYDVLMDRDGNSEVYPEDVRGCDSTDADSSYAETEYDADGKYVYTGKYNIYVLTDKGQDAAVKIANERRVRMIAENKWPVTGQSVDDNNPL